MLLDDTFFLQTCKKELPYFIAMLRPVLVSTPSSVKSTFTILLTTKLSMDIGCILLDLSNFVMIKQRTSHHSQSFLWK